PGRLSFRRRRRLLDRRCAARGACRGGPRPAARTAPRRVCRERPRQPRRRRRRSRAARERLRGPWAGAYVPLTGAGLPSGVLLDSETLQWVALVAAAVAVLAL